MPLLDVSDILDDPDFMDTMTVTWATETVNDLGRSVVTPQTFPNVPAVITAATGDLLKYLPDGARIEGAITVHTRFLLTSESETTAPDIIRWHGRDYVVTLLNDWSSYGDGFMQAICTLRNLVEASP